MRVVGSLTPATGWHHWHEGEEPHCPYGDCGRAFAGKIAPGRIVSTRQPGGEPDPDFLMPMICRRCGKPFEIGTPSGARAPRSLD